ncbi:hypothetical protein [Inquilinus sp. Marseille-Q2685]|uniref:hypothetical protein n=1 Tax=Inquilinus sp. Marseille-Q2685 TaxID=2866581 RepID=UPI001CE3D99E|nr:hypothetical protein [Inquilinus sp. Marseille-Q2685]
MVAAWSGRAGGHLVRDSVEPIVRRKHIRRHDPDAAEAAMVRHLDQSAVLYAHHA